MLRLLAVTLLALTAACANTANQEHNPKDIPVDMGAQPQKNVIVAAPPGTMGHGRF